MSHLKKMVMVFGVTTCIATMTFFFLYLFLFHLRAALILSPLTGCIFGVFAATHLSRNLRRATFTITALNKDPERPLNEYSNDLLEFLTAMRYSRHNIDPNTQRFVPRPLMRVLGGEILIHKDPYSIEIQGPYSLIAILAKTVEISQEYIKIDN